MDYWDASSYAFPSSAVKFQLKLDTDLYCLRKAGKDVIPYGLELSSDGEQFVLTASDWKVGLRRGHLVVDWLVD